MHKPEVSDAGHLTGLEVDRANCFLNETAQFFGLGRWVLYVSSDPAPEDAHACIKASEQRYWADVKLSADWMKLSDDGKASTLLHEVLHLMHTSVDFAFYQVIKDDGISDAIAIPYREAYERSIERMVDKLTGALWDALPWPYPSSQKAMAYAKRTGRIRAQS